MEKVYKSVSKITYVQPEYSMCPDAVKQSLADYGYAVVPGVICEEDLARLQKMSSDEFSEFTLGAVDISKPDTYNAWRKFLPTHSMLVQHNGIGNMRWLWEIRQNPKIAKVFSEFWGVGVNDLLVSMDGASMHLPHEYTKGCGKYKGNDWLHTDQSPLKKGMQCVQSWVNLYDTNAGDATLVVYDGSHLHHEAFFKMKEELGHELSKKDWYKINKKVKEEVEFFDNLQCKKVAIVCKAGDLVMWDSRLFHQGIESMEWRDKPNIRMVAYVCYTPRLFANEKALKKRIALFESGRTTTHWPHTPTPFPLKPRTYGMEIPPIQAVPPLGVMGLTELGKRLVGYQ